MEAAGVEGEGSGPPGQPPPEILEFCAAGTIADDRSVADPRNGPLHDVAPADPVTDALERARAAWIVGHDARRLRRSLLWLLAELED